MALIKSAPDVRDIADEIVRRWHPHLQGVRIEFVFREKAARRHGRVVAGAARKLSGHAAFFANSSGFADDFVDTKDCEFFVVEIAADVWAGLDADQRVALVDHELCHLRVEIDPETGEPSLSTRGHDVEEFTEIVERHGLWSESLQNLETAAQQLSFADQIGDLVVSVSAGTTTERVDVGGATSSVEEHGVSM